MKIELIKDYLEGAKEPFSRFIHTADSIKEKFINYYIKKDKGSEVCRWDESIKLHELWDKIIDLCKKDNLAAQHNYLKIFYKVINSFDPDTADEQFIRFFEYEDNYELLADWDIKLFGKVAI